MFRSRQLSERNLEVVGIVKGVEKIPVERVDVLEARETVEDGCDFLGESLCGILDLSDVESYDVSGLVVSIW